MLIYGPHGEAVLLSNATLLSNVGLDMMDQNVDLLFKLDNNVDLSFS